MEERESVCEREGENTGDGGGRMYSGSTYLVDTVVETQ